eukprot:JP443652.1.p1 GENE.JP443652.1~~JP443652.1.p1  ORF type:complete len:59 (+),score=5.18 JP443652.1:2-178(+)
MIRMYRTAGLWDDAHSLFSSLDSLKVQPDETTLSLMKSIYEKTLNSERLFELVTKYNM